MPWREKAGHDLSTSAHHRLAEGMRRVLTVVGGVLRRTQDARVMSDAARVAYTQRFRSESANATSKTGTRPAIQSQWTARPNSGFTMALIKTPALTITTATAIEVFQPLLPEARACSAAECRFLLGELMLIFFPPNGWRARWGAPSLDVALHGLDEVHHWLVHLSRIRRKRSDMNGGSSG